MAKELAIKIQNLAMDISSMESNIDGVDAEMAELIDSTKALDAMWEGEAKNAFTVQFGQDCEEMNSICKRIRELISCLEYAKTEYENCEREVDGLIAALKF